MTEDEIQKLLDHGEGWLAEHPQKERIARRYFARKKSYVNRVMAELLEEMPEEETDVSAADVGDETAEPAQDAAETDAAEGEASAEKHSTTLNKLRLRAVRDAVLASGAKTVIDMGCGECKLTSMLLSEPQIQKVTACDVSVRTLEIAGYKLHLDRMVPFRRNKLTLMQASLTYVDKRFSGFDCACIVEVIEHIEPMRIPAMERVVFEFAAPQTVIVTTPNREYNANYERMKEKALRHGDHRFEWTRAEFAAWAAHICEKFGYTCEISGIGDEDEALGTPTQMGVFTKHG